jgi:radical SAM family uncharacterized protein/radical SAM-linked protein
MTDLFKVLEEQIWPLVAKPARYIGCEFGLVRKPLAEVRLRMALVYPDLYEVGMSNLGLKVLYRAANSIEGVAAERAFIPWPDMENLMRARGVPLYSLETYTPLSDFDLLGVTLQSELTYTNVLTLLDLSGIPLRASERGESTPLVVGGGPCALNPQPMAPFFDLFVLGDGEEAIREISEVLLELKDKKYSRSMRLEALSRLPGVYVPAQEPGEKKKKSGVKVRRVYKLEAMEAPDGLPVPLTEIAQHHLAVELMRGCTRGCRFCQAGMYYRPVRVRPPQEVIELVRRGVRNGGWESITLLSLSSADYPGIEDLVENLLPEINNAGLALSFPSLRVDTSTLRLLERIESSRKSGLTIAVEAGSERLRKVIGKTVEEEHLIDLVSRAFRSGWTLIKLYFMVGLPTETDSDIDEIARLIEKVASVGRSIPGRRNVNVTISPFVPKPGTPFQREAQDPPEVIAGKLSRIRRQVRSRSVKLKCHNPRSSALEGLLCRGDSTVADVLETAWKLGARLDGWSERFDFSIWESAFEQHCFDWRTLLKKRPQSQVLPWHFVETPVNDSFLAAQCERGLEEVEVFDCKDGDCLDCGAEKAATCRKLRAQTVDGLKTAAQSEPLSRGNLPVATQDMQRRLWRIRYAKRGLLRFCGHLDMVRNLEFMLRRSGIPVCYSSGFSPRMRLHFSAPLPLGLESSAEYFELETLPGVSGRELQKALERASVGLEGFSVEDVCSLPFGVLPALAEDICLCSYKAVFSAKNLADTGNWYEHLEECKKLRLEDGAVVSWTDRKNRRREAVVLDAVRSVEATTADNSELGLTFKLELQGQNACRPDRFLSCFLGLASEIITVARIEKVCSYVRRGDLLKDPMEI